MLSDVDSMNAEEEESLFGSPPLSPRIGRSPSPVLALPSRSESIVNLQNVGTIALPGSHYSSKLPVNPLALLPSFTQAASQPLIQPQNSAGHLGSYISSPSSSSPCTPSSSRASSQGPFSGQSKRKHSRQQSHISRLPPPEIPLPDPTVPPPVNWLRSQSALLGHAGLVGGIRPSTLSNRHSRGSTSTNPIVIDEDKQIDYHPFSSKRSCPTPRYQLPTSSNLPTPSIQEIVQILLKQREIFPVLEDILKLSQNGFPVLTKPTNSCPSPLPKKRKLNRVPAGADDWDVPYPFQPGEGPQAYSSTWEQTRGKQLVSQLVSLIKAASHKAAIRKYMEQTQQHKLPSIPRSQSPTSDWEPAMPKVDGRCRPENLPDVPKQEILADASNIPEKCLDLPSSFSAPESSLFDELLASLLTVTPKSGDSDEAASSSNVGLLIANTSSQESTPELDQSVIDNWISIFQAYHVAAPLEHTATQFPESSSSLVRHCAGASSMPDSPLDLNRWDGIRRDSDLQSPFPRSVDSLSALPMDIYGHSRIAFQTADPLSFDPIPAPPSTNSTQDGFSLPPPPLATANNLATLSGTPSLIYSTIPSLSSFGDVDLISPVPQAIGYLDSLNAPVVSDQSECGKLSFLNGVIDEEIGDGRHLSTGLMDCPGGMWRDNMQPHPNTQGFHQPLKAQSAQNSHEPDFLAVPLHALLPLLASNVCTPPTNTGASSVFTPHVVPPYNPSGRTIDKAELLRRARDRRSQLAEEILRTRTQLWETTIEHGVLTRLAKLYT